MLHFFPSLPAQESSLACGYNRICGVMNSLTNLSMFSTHSALWEPTMTDKRRAADTPQHGGGSRREGKEGKVIPIMLSWGRLDDS